MASPSWTATRDRGFAVASRLPVTAKDVLDLALFESHTKDVNASAGHLILKSTGGQRPGGLGFRFGRCDASMRLLLS